MDDPLITEPQSIEVAFYNGKRGKISIGDRFRDEHREKIEWEVVGWTGRSTYSPSGFGGTPTAVCKPLTPLVGFWKKYERADGNVDWCADSVAGMLFRARDQQSGSKSDG